jgi:hypothetical protein
MAAQSRGWPNPKSSKQEGSGNLQQLSKLAAGYTQNINWPFVS